MTDQTQNKKYLSLLLYVYLSKFNNINSIEFLAELIQLVNPDSSVGIATDYEIDGRGSIPGRVKKFFCSPQRPKR
jgi:HKD family nuclease